MRQKSKREESNENIKKKKELYHVDKVKIYKLEKNINTI